jgi:hypothetical protein
MTLASPGHEIDFIFGRNVGNGEHAEVMIGERVYRGHALGISDTGPEFGYAMIDFIGVFRISGIPMILGLKAPARQSTRTNVRYGQNTNTDEGRGGINLSGPQATRSPGPRSSDTSIEELSIFKLI